MKNYEYPQWAKAENMEMSTPLCDLWEYSDTVVRMTSIRIYVIRMRKILSGLLYQFADMISVKEDIAGSVEY